MIKRQFYALEHANRGDAPSSSSSSSSLDSENDGEGGSDLDDSGASRENPWSSEDEVQEAGKSDSSEGTAELDDGEEHGDGEAADDAGEVERRRRKLANQWAEAVDEDRAEGNAEKFADSVVVPVGASNRVLKCRWCPKVLCLSEESMQAHLASKRHARSLKQLAEGRLKLQLDSDGEEEEDGETHAERFARTVTTVHEEKFAKRKRDSGRQRQRKRLKRKALLDGKGRKTEVSQVSSANCGKKVASVAKGQQKRGKNIGELQKDAFKPKTGMDGQRPPKLKRETLAKKVKLDTVPSARKKTDTASGGKMKARK